MRRQGFTFVEVTAAVAIGAFVTLVAVGALKSTSDGTRTVRQHSEMAAEMRFVMQLMRQDLANGWKLHPAVILRISRPGAPISASSAKDKKAPSLSIH